MIEIEQLTFTFSGRYGNNIIQIMNALHVHLNNFQSILLIPNGRSTIKSQVINKHNLQYIKCKEKLDSIFLQDSNTSQFYRIKHTKLNNIFFWTKNKKYNSSYITFEDRLTYSNIICNEILELPLIKSNLQKEDLLIHLRSTDIYGPKALQSYAQPPLSFYSKVIDDNDFKNVYIISDDNNNYMARLLKDKYKYINFIDEKNTKKAFNIIRCAPNICTSFSSFCTTATLLKPKNLEKNIFTFEYVCFRDGVWNFGTMFDGILNRPGYNYNIYKIIDYPFIIKNGNSFKGNWSFNAETMKIMRSHSINNIIKLNNNEFR